VLTRLFLTLTFVVALWPSLALAQERRTVDKAEIEVWDGDTIKTNKDGRIRLRNCDAPKLLSPERDAGIRARDRLIGLIESSRFAELRCSWEPPCETASVA
jgi:endonuclease YncB( thermonuclease family)